MPAGSCSNTTKRDGDKVAAPVFSLTDMIVRELVTTVPAAEGDESRTKSDLRNVAAKSAAVLPARAPRWQGASAALAALERCAQQRFSASPPLSAAPPAAERGASVASAALERRMSDVMNHESRCSESAF